MRPPALTFSFLAAALLTFPALRSQCVYNISTGFDQELDSVVLEGDPEDEWILADSPLGVIDPIFTVNSGGCAIFPIPPWICNDENSLWLAPTADTNGSPGVYTWQITFNLPGGVEVAPLTLAGKYATDDANLDVLINGVSTGVGGGGFGAFSVLPENTGLGLFQEGTNTIEFLVENGTVADPNPTGLRVEACVASPPDTPEDRPFNISTGFDEAARQPLADGAADTSYTLTGPGIGPQAPVAVPDAETPASWFGRTINSRWVGLSSAGSSGPPGEYVYSVDVTLPPEFDAARGVLRGRFAGDERVSNVFVNGTELGLTSGDPARLTPFPVEAGRGLLRNGANTVELVVTNDSEGSTGLRVDAQIIEGPPDPGAAVSVLSLDTGFDNEAAALIDNGLPDDNWVIVGPPGSDLGPVLATVVPDDQFPIGPWIASTAQSKWIGTSELSSNGPPGDYRFRITVNIPDGLDAASARIIGRWQSDNMGVDLHVNGVSTLLAPTGNFVVLEDIPADAGLGLFQNGDNTVEVIVNNAGDNLNPIGFRMEAVIGVSAPDPNDLSSGVSPRGVGPLPPGVADERYTVTGPEGSGIGPQPAVVPAAPPGFANSASSQWIGLDGADSSGPAGRYTYDLAFTLGGQFNPLKVVLQGGWAAAPGGGEVGLNGTVLEGAGGAGPDALIAFPVDAGLGLFVAGPNVLTFEVDSAAAGPTGLRVEGRVEAVARANRLDISTGFDQTAGAVLADDALDEDYTVMDPFGVEEQATVVPGVTEAVPTWAGNTVTSKWIGIPGAVLAAPGIYVYRTMVTLTAAEAAKAVLRGAYATDDASVDVRVNDISAGVTSMGFGALTPFPPDAGLGLFVEGENLIEFTVENGGVDPNPSGLRVDAVVVVGEEVPPVVRFVRGDVDRSGAINLTDGIQILLHLFRAAGLPAPLGCLDAADADDSNSINLTDGVRVFLFLFQGAPIPLPSPETSGEATVADPGDCGPDPGEDAIECESPPEYCL